MHCSQSLFRGKTHTAFLKAYPNAPRNVPPLKAGRTNSCFAFNRQSKGRSENVSIQAIYAAF
ncbi:MAG: hypothetical protein ACOCZ2_05045 [Thermodesulfobacteriota bacterium]